MGSSYFMETYWMENITEGLFMLKVNATTTILLYIFPH